MGLIYRLWSNLDFMIGSIFDTLDYDQIVFMSNKAFDLLGLIMGPRGNISNLKNKTNCKTFPQGSGCEQKDEDSIRQVRKTLSKNVRRLIFDRVVN